MEDIKKLTIKDWAIDDRPREKLISKGITSLSDAELIAILIGSGNRDESAVELSKKILSKANNNLNELGKYTINDLKKNKGIGEAKAISIIAALELGRRRKSTDIIQKQVIECSSDTFEIFHPLLSDLFYEEFWVMCLNRSNKIIDKSRFSQGGISSSIVDVRLIMKYAIEKIATSIVLCHNHPSGNIQPSKNDISITNKLKEAGLILDIRILDHVIVADNKYFSFADEGIL